MKTIAIANIQINEKAQVREKLDQAAIDEYAEAMQNGSQFPPIVVFFDGVEYWLADGAHRIKAALKNGADGIEADVKEGTLRDAVLYALAANIAHGVRLTNADKRRKVAIMLADKEWSGWSDGQIANHAHVTQPFVSKLRKKTASHNSYEMNTNPSKRKAKRNGKEYSVCQAKRSVHKEEQVEEQAEPVSEPAKQEEKPATQKPALVLAPSPVIPEGNSQFNRTNNNIEWAPWSWNPVVGCKHGCSYCYARDLHKRFTEKETGLPFEEAVFQESRLCAPYNTTIPKKEADKPGMHNVFLGSMTDLWGEWVPSEWIEKILAVCRDTPQWQYLALTKNPSRYLEFANIIPDNVWLGATVDTQERVESTGEVFSSLRFDEAMKNVLFISCEPLLEYVSFKSAYRKSYLSSVDWVIIGGCSESSGHAAFQPEWSWVEDLLIDAHDAKCCVYFKPNLTVRPKECPR